MLTTYRFTTRNLIFKTTVYKLRVGIESSVFKGIGWTQSPNLNFEFFPVFYILLFGKCNLNDRWPPSRLHSEYDGIFPVARNGVAPDRVATAFERPNTKLSRF